MRRDEVADGEDEGEEGAHHDAGKGERQDDMEEGPHRPRAQVGRRLPVVGRKLLQIGEDRQRQQHDEKMHEADDGGEARVGERKRRGEEAASAPAKDAAPKKPAAR